MGLFYAQRLLSGMHLLALLAGIYLMIFVVEPVAVPHEYLQQHFYGLPWSADRRLHRDNLENLQFLQRKSFITALDNGRRRQGISNDSPYTFPSGIYIHQNRNPVHKLKVSKISPVAKTPTSTRKTNATLTGTSRVRYISLQDLQSRRNKTASPTTKIHHWSQWLPQINSTSKLIPKNPQLSSWKPSQTVDKRGYSEEKYTEKANYNATGSITSLRLSDILRR